MRSNFFTILGVVCLVLFGWGMWLDVKGHIDRRHINEEQVLMEEENIVPIQDEQLQKSIKESILLSKGLMIAGLSGLFITLYKLNKKTKKIKPGYK